MFSCFESCHSYSTLIICNLRPLTSSCLKRCHQVSRDKLVRREFCCWQVFPWLWTNLEQFLAWTNIKTEFERWQHTQCSTRTLKPTLTVIFLDLTERKGVRNWYETTNYFVAAQKLARAVFRSLKCNAKTLIVCPVLNNILPRYATEVNWNPSMSTISYNFAITLRVQRRKWKDLQKKTTNYKII